MINYILSSFDFYFLTTIGIRTILSFFTTLILSIMFGGKLINFLKKKQKKGQPIRVDGPQSHLNKQGTPTMGGLLIIVTTIISSILWATWDNVFVITSIAVLVVYAIIGYIDDYEKVTKQTSNAMSAKTKLILQFTAALIATIAIVCTTSDDVRYSINIPYLKNMFLNISWFYIPFAMIVITGTSNAVNLTDGLDGLASGLLAVIFTFFTIIATLSSFTVLGSEEVAVICASVAGACIGFLWFNSFPAKVFMGDTGSLSLGALLGTVSVITKSELLLAIVGFIFVLEALSVIIQVYWYKKTGKRVFKMAPLHHHFEQKNVHENTIVMRFWIISLILAAIGFISFI